MKTFKVVALMVFLTVVTGTAVADDVFYGCSNNLTGKVRRVVVNMTPVCKSTETLRTWNETGPQGPTGPSDAFSTFADETPLPSGGVFLSLAQLSLDAGDYVVSAKASLTNSNAATTAIAYCAIIRGAGFPGLNDQTIATINGVGTVAVSAVLPVTLPTANVVRFQCTNNIEPGHDGDLVAKMVTMVAIRVGTLTPQAPPG